MKFARPESQMPLPMCHPLCLRCWVVSKVRDQNCDPQNRGHIHELAQNRPKYADALKRIIAGKTVKPTDDVVSFLHRRLCISPDDNLRLNNIIRHNRRTPKSRVLRDCWHL